TTATIKWKTDKASDSRVEYGLDTNYGTVSVINPAQITDHSVALTGLAPGQTYHYRVISRDSAGGQVASGDLTFNTVPVPDTTPPTFVAGSIKGTTVDSQSEKITWT